MPTFRWSDRYSIGIPQLDEHHQHLFTLLRKTYDDFINKAPYQDLDVLLDELIDYATFHISAEEQCMLEAGFPDLEKQKMEHDLFFLKITEMCKSYHNGRKHLLVEILSFLHNWITTHILHLDTKFGCFIAIKNNGNEHIAGKEKVSV